eukprot:gene18386-25045_t
MKKSPHTAEFKFKVALDAIRGTKTTAELCSEYGIVSSQLFKWKKALVDQGAEVFKSGLPIAHDQVSREAPMKQRLLWALKETNPLSLRQKCNLLGVN